MLIHPRTPLLIEASVLKGLLALALICLFAATPTAAQKFEITPFGGYQLGGSISVKEGNLQLDDASNFGLIFNYPIAEFFQIEASYSRQSTTLKFDRRNTSAKETLFDIATEYIHAGIMYVVPIGKAQPFGTVTIGATHFKPKPSAFSDAWRFSAGMGFGSKFTVSEHIGFRIQGRLLLAFQPGDNEIFCINADQDQAFCSNILSTSSTTLQSDLIAGVIFAF